MPNLQMTAPLIVKGANARPLERMSVTDIESEAWLQNLLFQHPELLPFAELEPVAAESITIARELPVGPGRLDLLYANSDGYLTLVETKLWRNPEARRAVVAQIIEYAAEMARWDYQHLVRAVGGEIGKKGNPLATLLRAQDEQFDEARFTDTVSRNLARGRFLLLIVGDGIQEGVEQLAEFMQRWPQLGFTLALVEMAVFRIGDSPDGEVLVQPRIVARTREVVRAVVEINAPSSVRDVKVTLPDAPPATAETTPALTESAFLERIASTVGRNEAEAVKDLLIGASQHNLQQHWGKTSVALYYYHEESGYYFHFGRIDRQGGVVIDKLYDHCLKLHLPDSVWKTYLEGIARLVPGARVATLTEASGKEYKQVLCEGNRNPPASALAARMPQWLELVDGTIALIDASMTGARSNVKR